VKPEKIWLKDSVEFNERWLQDRIEEDPSLLGLGDLYLVERERRQERAGRLDLLLSNSDQTERYEVEIQLGRTDESHIIRCMEYWDIERRRYPGYDHVAVLIAEDVTTRFLQLLSLFAGTIPMVVVQVNALKVSDQIVLDCVHVLDQTSLRQDDTEQAHLQSVDKTYWVDKSSKSVLNLVQKLLDMINEFADPKQKLNYNRQYIGLTDGVRSRNFVKFTPRKKFLHVRARLDDANSWVERLEVAGLNADNHKARARVVLTPSEFSEHREVLTEFLRDAVSFEQGGS